MISRRSFLQTCGIAMLGAVSAPAYAIGVEPFRLSLKHYHLTPPRWPTGLNLKAALIADPHVCDPWMGLERVRSIVRQTNALKPDIILMLGDYVASHKWQYDPIPPQAWADLFGDLSAPLGTHAILGNHDYWDDRTYQRDQSSVPFVVDALQGVGISTYVNEAARIEKDGHRFWLAGLGDQLALLPGSAYGRPAMQGVDDLDATLAAIPHGEPVILMAHEPDIFPSVDDRVSLTLSGHTHGGQFNLLGWRPFSASRGSAKYPAGYFNIDGRELIVSRGLGCSVLPLRIGSYPETLLLELG